MTVFRTKWDDWNIPDTPKCRTDNTDSVSTVSAALGHIRPENGFCQQCGDAIADDDEFINSVTGGVRGRLHDRCYWSWFKAHVRGQYNPTLKSLETRIR